MTQVSMSNENSLSVTWSAKTQEYQHVTTRALLFLLAGSTYAISVDFVRRVTELPVVVPVPGSSKWFMGMVNCDGESLPLINPHPLFNTQADDIELTDCSNKLARAIVIDSAHGTLLLAVDQITTLADLSARHKHEIAPVEYPAGFLEYSCESNEVTVGVLSIVKLFEALSDQSNPPAGSRVAGKLQSGAES